MFANFAIYFIKDFKCIEYIFQFSIWKLVYKMLFFLTTAHLFVDLQKVLKNTNFYKHLVATYFSVDKVAL